jgi:hypothetical protein
MFSYINAGKIYHKNCMYSGLPADECMMFETCRRHEELI